MNIKALFAGGLLAVSASASMAQSLDPVRIEMFRSILAGNECTLTEAAASNILPRFDFTRDETRAIVGALVAAGEVQLDGNTLMLVDGSCAVEDPVVALLERTDVQQFIAVMSEYNCSMTEGDGQRIFTERGISKAQVGTIVGPMIQAGMAAFEAGILSVDSAYCSAPVVAEVAAPVVGSPVEAASEMVELDRSGMFGMGRVRQLVDVMAANSCTLNMETPDGFLAAAGIEHSFATFVARKMITDGFASMVDAENMLLSAPYCVSAGGAPEPLVVDITVEVPLVNLAEQVATLRQIFVENQCRLTNDQMDIVLPPAGFTKDNIVGVFDVFEERGELTIFDDYLLLTGVGCPAAAVETVTSQAVEMDRSGMFGMGQVRGLVDVMAQNGCTLNMEVADGYLGAAGIEHSFATFMARKMISDGNASMVDAENMVLSAPYCIAAGGAAVVAQVETAVEQPVETESDEPGVDMAMVATMRRIFAENGCRLGNEQMQEVLPPAGFTRTNVRPIFDFLEVTGEMTKVDGILIMAADSCTAAPVEAPVAAAPAFENDGSPRGRFIAAVIGNGCALEVSGAEGYLAESADLRMDQAFRIVDEMVAEGEATLISDGSTVQIDLAYCAETGTALVMEQVSPSTYPASPEGVMIAMMRRNSCEMSMADARAQFPVAGVTIEQFHPLLDRYLGNGRMDLSADGQTLSFVGPSCFSTPGSTEISDAITDEAVAQRNAANADMEAQRAAVIAEMNAEQGEAQVETGARAGLLAMLAANNCEVTQANAAALISAAGLDFNASMQMLTQMMGTGEATSPDGGQTLQVSAPLCVASGGAEPMTPRETFINLIKQNNCSITAAEFSSLLPVDGLDANTAFGMIGELEAEGVISLPATRDVVTLSAEMCR